MCTTTPLLKVVVSVTAWPWVSSPRRTAAGLDRHDQIDPQAELIHSWAAEPTLSWVFGEYALRGARETAGGLVKAVLNAPDHGPRLNTACAALRPISLIPVRSFDTKCVEQHPPGWSSGLYAKLQYSLDEVCESRSIHPARTSPYRQVNGECLGYLVD